jgi:hypothetical protein
MVIFNTLKIESNMKKYIYSLLATIFVAAAITSCEDEAGKKPGNDTDPSVIVYSYGASAPADPDCEVLFRIASNNKVKTLYYLLDKADNKEAKIASSGEEGYIEYVIENGTKVDLSDATNTDLNLTLAGTYTLTAVGVDGAKKASSSATFAGIPWKDVCKGNYKFGASANLIKQYGLTTNPCTLQVREDDPNSYRLKDCYGAGYSLKFTLMGVQTSDDDGTIELCRIPAQNTPFSYGSYGTVSVRDVAYWQGDDTYATSSSFSNKMWTSDHKCSFALQYYVSAGNLGYGRETFIPD